MRRITLSITVACRHLSPAGWYKQLMLKKILRFLSSALHLVLRLIQFGATLAGRTGSNIHIAGL